MTLLEKAQANAAEIQRAGLLALEDARRAGVPAYYIDPALGAGIIREMPDGTRQRLVVDGGREVVAEVFGPRS